MVESKKKPAVKYRFSGHQTFFFRHGWIEKGVRAVESNHEALAEENALVALGVGKNMVESIRHWCLVTHMVEEVATEKRNNGRLLAPTQIARRLLLGNGWDPFLEDDPQLRLVMRRIVESTPDEAGAASVLALVSGRPPANWLDEDIARFPELAKAIGDPVRRAVARAAEGAGVADPLFGLSAKHAKAAKTLAQDLGRRLAGARRDAANEVVRAALLILAGEVGE